MAQPLMPAPLVPELPTTTELDASPSRERLGRVVELLRGVEDDLGTRRPVVRAAPRRRPRHAAAVRPMPVSWAETGEPVA